MIETEPMQQYMERLTVEELEETQRTLRRLWPKGPGNDAEKQALLMSLRVIQGVIENKS